MSIKSALKSVYSVVSNCMKQYSPHFYAAIGAMMMVTAIACSIIWIIAFKIPNGTGNDVLLLKINVLANMNYGFIGVIAMGVTGLFMLAKAFSHLKAAAMGGSIEIGDAATPSQQPPVQVPYAPPPQDGPQVVG